MSGTLPQRSMRPSPSKSCAWRRQLDGMNCGQPIAPAYDPRTTSGSNAPSRASSRNSSSSDWKNAMRPDVPKPSVASASSTRYVPVTRPKTVSMPMIATTISSGTPYVSRTRWSVASCSFQNRTPASMRTRSTCPRRNTDHGRDVPGVASARAADGCGRASSSTFVTQSRSSWCFAMMRSAKTSMSGRSSGGGSFARTGTASAAADSRNARRETVTESCGR